jgi:hypothetical protein
MEVREFSFTYRFGKKKFGASCMVFQVAGHHNYPMYRVAVKQRSGESDIYIFYFTHAKDLPFFWYPLPGLKNKIAKAISIALGDYPQ